MKTKLIHHPDLDLGKRNRGGIGVIPVYYYINTPTQLCTYCKYQFTITVTLTVLDCLKLNVTLLELHTCDKALRLLYPVQQPGSY